MQDRITVTMTGGVADVRLTRADKMNALDDAMFQALIDTGEALKTQKGLRAVVLSGEGRAFCAGLDMGNFGKMASGERKGGAGLVNTQRTAGGANRAQHAAIVWREVPVRVIAARPAHGDHGDQMGSCARHGRYCPVAPLDPRRRGAGPDL